MKLFLPLFFALFSISAFGQIALERNLTKEVEASSTRTALYFEVSNTGTADTDFYWEIDRNGCPDEWSFSICDVNTCYPFDTESSPCGNPSFMAAGDSYEFTIYINPNGVEGEHSIIFRALGTCDDTASMLAETNMTWSVMGGSSVEDVDVSNIVLYPNPSSGEFKITDDANVKSVAIYNIVGKRIMTENHISNQSHNISSLEKGFYLVRMLDEKQQIVKVLRLTKE